MVEEKTEKKKTRIVKRIFKWLGLGLLSILLIAAVIFQAPWKVITLLAVLPCACALLAKPVRKWFWLSVAAVVVILIIWVFLPDETEGWRPYTFDKELAAMEAKRVIPAEENAATIYNQLLENYDANDFEPNLSDPDAYHLTRSGPWSSRDYPEMAEWLKGHQTTIAKLTEASKIKQCRFPINANIITLGQQMDRLGAMKRWADLLIIAANNDMAEGRINQALEKHIAVLQMGKHQNQQPSLIDLLVGVSIEALSTSQFNRFIVAGDATEEHLSVIEEALAEIKHDWSSDFPRLLEHEKLLAKNFWGVFYAVNPEGQVRLNPGIAIRKITAQLPEDMKDKFVITYWHERIMKAWTILYWFYMPSTPQKAGEIIDAKYEKFYVMANHNFNWQKKVERPTKMLRLNYQYLIDLLAGILEPTYYSIHDTYLRAIAQQRGSGLIIALRRYKNKNGNWPVSLDEIKSLATAEIFVDPINGDSFIYKLTDENFTLYSKGKNNIDEDGKRDRLDEEKTGADDQLIWPQKGRNAKEVKTDAH